MQKKLQRLWLNFNLHLLFCDNFEISKLYTLKMAKAKATTELLKPFNHFDSYLTHCIIDSFLWIVK